MKLLKNANQYAKQTNWIDFGLLKVCLCALGVIAGLLVPKENKKSALVGSAAVFSMTFCPLLVRYYKSISVNEKKHQ